ncbi:MAG TPA: TonB-dependent receptor [Bryobacteraceae bacterium]|nr:TonB-dependent receptor [Bryobacteraceae bacterium]
MTTATFYGTLTDPTGGVVAGATVSLENVGTGAVSTKVTDATGDFVFEFLRVGIYRIQVKAAGFKGLQSGSFELQAGQSMRRTFQLELGQVNETVSVEGTAPLVNSISSEQQNSVSTTESSQLPLSRRNVSGLLSLGTGASPGGGYVRLNGTGKTGTLFSVDGTSASSDPESRTSSMRGNFDYINLVSLEAVQEVATTKGIMPAEYGQVLSGNVNIITKSGTNHWHGSAFEDLQSDNLNSPLQFLATKPNAVFNQFGGSIGGPIIHDRLFIFGDYEGYRQSVTQVVSGSVPTPDFRQLLLSTVPAYSKALEGVPLPNQPFAAGADTGLYIFGRSQTAHDDHFDVKSDLHLTDTSNLSLTYSHGRPGLLTPRIYSNDDQVYHGYLERGTASYITGGPAWSSKRTSDSA